MQDSIEGIRKYWSKVWTIDSKGLDISFPVTLFKFKKYIKPCLDKIKIGGKVLEVGCGNGQWLFLVKSYRPDIEIYGLDCLPEVVERAVESGINASFGDARELPYRDSKFDLVFSWGVVEHVHETELEIMEHFRVSNKFVIIDVPNRISIPALLKKRTFKKRKLNSEEIMYEFGKMYSKAEFMKMIDLCSKDSWVKRYFSNYMVLPARFRSFEGLVPDFIRERIGQNIGVIAEKKLD